MQPIGRNQEYAAHREIKKTMQKEFQKSMVTIFSECKTKWHDRGKLSPHPLNVNLFTKILYGPFPFASQNNSVLKPLGGLRLDGCPLPGAAETQWATEGCLGTAGWGGLPEPGRARRASSRDKGDARVGYQNPTRVRVWGMHGEEGAGWCRVSEPKWVR